MTTITVKEGNEKFIKKNFNSAKDLFIYLREVLSPVEIHLIEDVDIPESLNKSIEQAFEVGDKDTVDFKG